MTNVCAWQVHMRTPCMECWQRNMWGRKQEDRMESLPKHVVVQLYCLWHTADVLYCLCHLHHVALLGAHSASACCPTQLAGCP